MTSADTNSRSTGPVGRVAFLGPEGTFTEQALLTQPDLAEMELVAKGSIADVLFATQAGEVDVGFVPIENSIEGSVNTTLDTLVFETDLMMQREVVISVQLNLLVQPGTAIGDIATVLSMPVAAAQCRTYLREQLGNASVEHANSTAEAAQRTAASDGTVAGIGTTLAAKLNGLEVLATDIEDHPENQTRFVALRREGIPVATGHDKTSVVVFQRADRPGSLLAILQEFAARAINLTRLESRPTKQQLGEYCFLIDLEGHIEDEVVADALRELKSKHADVKFLGSYHAAGDEGVTVRRDAEASWRDADEWIRGLRSQLRA